MAIDPKLVFAWQTAHSLARQAPLPVYDRGGFRVDTHAEKEVKRWVFPQLCEGLLAVAKEITAPRHFLKLCGSNDELRAVLPERWEIQPANYFMQARPGAGGTSSLPEGYTIEVQQNGPVSKACVIAPDGEVAAHGTAAQTSDAFIYDRIETAQNHRRKGLGMAVMSALASAQRSAIVPQLLVATEEGRSLYTRLGWDVIAPFAAATIAERR
jgi:GNAT superfamily N-acetyltransferase